MVDSGCGADGLDDKLGGEKVWRVGMTSSLSLYSGGHHVLVVGEGQGRGWSTRATGARSAESFGRARLTHPLPDLLPDVQGEGERQARVCHITSWSNASTDCGDGR